MKKEVDNEMEDELCPEYDFSQIKGGVRGKYTEPYTTGTNLVLLDPDVENYKNHDRVTRKSGLY